MSETFLPAHGKPSNEAQLLVTADWISADTALFVLRAVSGLDVVTGKNPYHAEDGAEATPVSSPRPSSAPHAETVRLPLKQLERRNKVRVCPRICAGFGSSRSSYANWEQQAD